MRIVAKVIDELIEEVRRSDQFDEEFDINSNAIMTSNNDTEENN